MSTSRKRPKFPGQLNLEDIEPGTRVVVHCTAFHPNTRDLLTIISDPYLLNRTQLWVTTQNDCGVSQCSLADLGVTPFGNGHWSCTNYTTLAPPEPVWGCDSYYRPTKYWVEIAPGVQMKSAPGGGWSSAGPVATAVQVRIQHPDCSCGHAWGEPKRHQLTAHWADLAPGVQARKDGHHTGVLIRRLQEP